MRFEKSRIIMVLLAMFFLLTGLAAVASADFTGKIESIIEGLSGEVSSESSNELNGELSGEGISGENADIPEFPTVALPMLSVLGLMFIFGRWNKKI